MKGFIFTGYTDMRKKVSRYHYFARCQGETIEIVITNDKPVFFVERSSRAQHSDRREVSLKTMAGKEVDAFYFNSQVELLEKKQKFESQKIRTFESDIRAHERYLMERFIYGGVEVEGDFEQTGKRKVFMNPVLKPTTFHPKFCDLSVDIETGVGGELYSIAYYSNHPLYPSHVYMLDEKSEYKNSDDIDFFVTQKELLSKFLQDLQLIDPDLLFGWHVIGFDFEFMQKKCLEFGLDFHVGRTKSASRIQHRNGNFYMDIVGRVVVDGPVNLRANFHDFANYKLGFVATKVLGKNKDIEDDGKVEEIERRFREDKISLAKYNVLDCKLVTDIYKKLDLINTLTERSKVSGLCLDRIGISTAAFDYFLLPKLHRKGYVAYNSFEIERAEESSGGMVFSPKTGEHSHVAIFDFKSLYPSIIRTFHIDPYSLISNATNSLQTPSGVEFSRTQHLLAPRIASLLEERQQAKEYGNNSLSHAIKILMNSFYGVMGSTRSRFYHPDLPKAITETGHWLLHKAKDFFELRDLPVLYGDTDSVFVQFSEKPSEDEILQITSQANDYFSGILKDEFNITSFLEIEFEKIYDKIIFPTKRNETTGAKKKYVGFYQDKVDDPVDFIGMEYVRSDWTALAKKFQKEIYERHFYQMDIDNWIKEFIEMLEAGSFDTLLIYTKRLTKAPQEYTKNIPPHVKAALLVDHTGPYRLKSVSYMITNKGPIPIQNKIESIDYAHYVEKQIKPIADVVLYLYGKSFDELIKGEQLSLF